MLTPCRSSVVVRCPESKGGFRHAETVDLAHALAQAPRELSAMFVAFSRCFWSEKGVRRCRT